MTDALHISPGTDLQKIFKINLGYIVGAIRDYNLMYRSPKEYIDCFFLDSHSVVLDKYVISQNQDETFNVTSSDTLETNTLSKSDMLLAITCLSKLNPQFTFYAK